MKRLTFLGLALSALAAVALTVTACAGGDGLVTATPVGGGDGSRNMPGEIFDTLLNGSTVGTRFGNTTFIPGKGLQFNDVNAYLMYEPYYPLVNGEFSMEVEGLKPNVYPASGKPKIFQIGDLRDANVTNSNNMINAQYRGTPGNPDNCIAFKAVLGGPSVEPDAGARAAGQRNLDPAKTYFWQGRWTNTSFNLVVKEGGVGGNAIYDTTLTNNAGTGFSASQMFAFLGSNDAKFNADTGSVPGMIIRNVWLSDKPRP